MKLATLKDGSRDGQLVVVSRDLMSAHYATGMADRMQQALDDWTFISPQLQDLYDTLNHGKARHAFVFEPRQCMAPLPRAFLMVVGQAYGGVQEQLATFQLACADQLLGPCAPLVLPDPQAGADFAAALAVVTGDIPHRATADQALDGVRLLMLANHVRSPRCTEGKPLSDPPWSATAFSPVAVTPDELAWRQEAAWSGGRPSLDLRCSVNGRAFGQGDTGAAMTLPFGELLAHWCRTRRVCSGSIFSSGEVKFSDVGKVSASIAARRDPEAALEGGSRTPWLAPGDVLRLEVIGPDGQSVFGAIEQTLGTPV